MAARRSAAERRHVESMFGMGVLYRDSWGVKKESELAARWFNVAARRGDGRSAFHLSQQLFLELG